MTKDGNLSSAGAFEFRRRIITSVEDDLLAWYPMDKSFGTKVHDVSGRLRHGDYVGSTDATVPDPAMYMLQVRMSPILPRMLLMMAVIQAILDGLPIVMICL